MKFEVDGTHADLGTVESLIDIIMIAMSLAPFEYSESEAGVALCHVLALLVGEEETLH